MGPPSAGLGSMAESHADNQFSGSTRALLRRAKAGDRAALEHAFERLARSLRKWAHGRLPRWARDAAETADVVQQAMANVFGRLNHFEPRHRNALRAYLRQAVRNQIRDEIRRAHTHGFPQQIEDLKLAGSASPHAAAVEAEELRRYLRGLARLPLPDQELIVARLELGYSYDQIALMTRRLSPDSARMAIKRALLRLAEAIDAA